MTTTGRSVQHVQISARVPADLAAALEHAAASADRSLSAELRRAIRSYLTAPVADSDLRRAA